MATVKQVLDFSKGVARDTRELVFNYLDPLEQHERMIANGQLARSLRQLARNLEDWTPPPADDVYLASTVTADDYETIRTSDE